MYSTEELQNELDRIVIANEQKQSETTYEMRICNGPYGKCDAIKSGEYEDVSKPNGTCLFEECERWDSKHMMCRIVFEYVERKHK